MDTRTKLLNGCLAQEVQMMMMMTIFSMTMSKYPTGATTTQKRQSLNQGKCQNFQQ